MKECNGMVRSGEGRFPKERRRRSGSNVEVPLVTTRAACVVYVHVYYVLLAGTALTTEKSECSGGGLSSVPDLAPS